MFSRKPKIKQIAVAASDGLLFTIGLGKNGKCYSWDSTNLVWILHQSVPMPPQEQK
jgi:hypothetical protein